MSTITTFAPEVDVMETWHTRWKLILSPAPGILGMVPVNMTPERVASRKFDTRPAMVIWLMAMEDGSVRMARVPGICSESWKAAVEAVGHLPMLHDNSSLFSLGTIMSSLPPMGIDGKAHLSDALKVAIRKEGVEMMKKFRALLLPEALQVARSTLSKKGSWPTVNSYNVFAGADAHPQARSSSDAGEWRRQFSLRWPLLSKRLASQRDLIEACDRGESMPMAIAVAISVSIPTVRAIAGKPFGKNDKSVFAPKSFERAIRLADALPVSLLPKDAPQWNACLRFANNISKLLSSSHSMTFLNMPLKKPPFKGQANNTISPCLPGTATWLESLVRRSGSLWAVAEIQQEYEMALENPPQRTRAATGRLHDSDTCLAFAREVLVPIISADNTDDTLVEDMYRIGNIYNTNFMSTQGALALLSRRSMHAFHMTCWRHLEWSRLPQLILVPPLEDFAAPVSDEPRVVRRSGWAALAPDIQTPDGWTIRNLVNQADLNAESADMNHCVRTYGWMCVEGASSIFSLLGPSGARSTAEVRLGAAVKDRDGKTLPAHLRLTTVQHKGIGNEVIPKGAAAAVFWYLEQIASGELKPDAERLALMERGPNCLVGNDCMVAARLADMQAMAEPEARRLAWRRWRRWLDAREDTPEKWVAALPRELSLISSFSPYQTCTGRC